MKIRELLHKQSVQELLRWGIIGVIATAIHYGIYYGLNLILYTNVAYTIGYIVSFFANFYLNSHFTFKTSVSVKKGVGFGIAHIVNYCMHIIFLNLFLHLGCSETIAPIFVFIVVFPINFILVRFVFKNDFKETVSNIALKMKRNQ
jgi:putative flippase GtrA